MLQVTKKARRLLAIMRREHGPADSDVRLFTTGKGDGVGMAFTTAPRSGDRLVEADGVRVAAAPAIAERIDRSIIDVGRGSNGQPCLMLKTQPRPWPSAT